MMTLDEACAFLNGYYVYVRGVGEYDHEENGVWEFTVSTYFDTDWARHKEDVVLSDGELQGVRVYSVMDGKEYDRLIPFDGAEHTMRYHEDVGKGHWWNIYDIEYTICFVSKDAVAGNAQIKSTADAEDKRIMLKYC